MIALLALFLIFQIVFGYNVEFNTSVGRNNSNYEWEKFLPNSAGFLDFRVKIKADAYIALVVEPALNDPHFVITIGGWNNTRSVIQNGYKIVASQDTQDYLSESEFRSFWIRWKEGSISVGRDGETSPFLNYTDPDPFPIIYVGFTTPFSGSWVVESNYRWIPSTQVQIPNKVIGGQENDILNVIRAQIGNSLIPGKLLYGTVAHVVAPNNTQIGVAQYEVLVDLVGGVWEKTNGSYIPCNAIQGGYTEDGEPLYIGRAPYKGYLEIGKVVPSEGTLYVPAWGVGSFDEYDILVQN